MLEVLRGEIALTGYAWYLLGHPMIDVPALSAPAAVVSAYGVSMLVAALAGAVADAAGWSGVHRPIGGVGALAACVVGGGLSVAGRPGGESGAARDVVIGVVQTNVPQSNKMASTMAERLRDFSRFVDLTRQAAAGPPGPIEADLVVWPETMFPGRVINAAAIEVERGLGLSFRVDGPAGEGFAGGRVAATHFADELVSVQRSLGVPLLVGGIAIDGEYERWLIEEFRRRERDGVEAEGRPAVIREYNSAVVISGGKIQERRYDKVELTPFGEMIPYVWRFPKLQAVVVDLGARGMRFNLSPGTMVGGLDIQATGGKKVRAATPICFEATKAALCRSLILGDGAGGVLSGAGRASVLINLSNDGWFGDSDMGRAQHLLAARWRCVEMGVPMVRSVNTGYSAAIDRRGRVTALRLQDGGEARARVDGVLVASVRIDPERRPTVFERVGLGPAWAAAVLGVIGTLALLVRRRRLAALGV
jgi:apolipoprotein N-acyltransferase